MVRSIKRSYKRRSKGSFLLAVLVFLGCNFFFYELYSALYRYTTNEQTFPVSRVIIDGKFKYITQAEVASLVGKLAGGKNLVTLDIAPIHNALVQMPWVSQALVRKKMPDTLEIQLTEHVPSARWKTTGIYDANTDTVFYPDMQQVNLPLVTLSAPHDTLARILYEHAAAFIELTQGTRYYIQEVHLDAVRGYRIKLEGDVWLILGRESTPKLPMIRLKRFLLAFGQTRLKLKDISYVDLRYDNGFAVGSRDDNPPAVSSD